MVECKDKQYKDTSKQLQTTDFDAAVTRSFCNIAVHTTVVRLPSIGI